VARVETEADRWRVVINDFSKLRHSAEWPRFAFELQVLTGHSNANSVSLCEERVQRSLKANHSEFRVLDSMVFASSWVDDDGKAPQFCERGETCSDGVDRTIPCFFVWGGKVNIGDLRVDSPCPNPVSVERSPPFSRR
jgi:hypothetical protein